MRIFNKFLAAALIMGMAACSSDENGGGNEPSKPDSKEVIYSSISFRMPKKKAPARSTQKEGDEAGQAYENNVGSILVVLAKKTEAGDYGFITYALNDSPMSGNADSKHTIVFQDKDALYNEAGEGAADGSLVYVFAYCNPTPELRAKVAGTLNATSGVYEGGMKAGETFTDLECNTNVEGTWSKNGFLMTSIGEIKDGAQSVHCVQLPSKATLQTYNKPENAFPLGTVEVIRTACRFDFRDAAPEAATKPLTYTVYDENVTPKAPVADVKLTRVAMFNLRNEFYYLPRTKATADATDITLCPTFDGMEEGFVLSPAGTNITENLPEEIDPLAPTASLKWVSLEAVLGLDEDIDEGWTSPTDKEGYHIWRYATENSPAPGADPATASTTGYVFESEIVTYDDFGNVAEDGTKLVMYLYKDKLYPNAMAIAKEIENVPVSTLATAFEAAFDLTKDADGKVTAATPKSDEVVENMGFTAYKPNAQGKYLAYYFAYNKHNDDENVTEYGPMEFATVRNNVYKLAVTSIRKFGSFKPGDNVEDWDTYFTLDVKVRNWVVRVNNLDF